MAAKKSAFADASEAIIKAFHQLERAVMGSGPAKAAPVKTSTRKTAKKTAPNKARKKAARKPAKKTKKASRTRG